METEYGMDSGGLGRERREGYRLAWLCSLSLPSNKMSRGAMRGLAVWRHPVCVYYMCLYLSVSLMCFIIIPCCGAVIVVSVSCYSRLLSVCWSRFECCDCCCCYEDSCDWIVVALSRLMFINSCCDFLLIASDWSSRLSTAIIAQVWPVKQIRTYGWPE